MRSISRYTNYLTITVASLALVISSGGAAPALAGRATPVPPPLPASSEEKGAPLSQEQTLNMLQAHVPAQQIEAFARRDGVDFKMTPALEHDLRKAGATERLIQVLKKAASGPVPPRLPFSGLLGSFRVTAYGG